MIVVFDSNVWLKELGLRSGAGAAAKFFLKHSSARLAIPEVVRLEVQHNLESLLRGHIENICTNYRHLLTAFGTLKEIVLPSDADIQVKIEEIFASIDVDIVELPFTFESARSSFRKITDKAPPSSAHKQEFKDGVIWADCLELLASDSVALVTSDKAFYQDRSYAKGLAQNLKAEASGRPNELKIYPDLSKLLQKLRITLNEDSLAEAFLKEHDHSVYGILDRQGFDLGIRQLLDYTLFATESPTVLFLRFSMSYACTDIRGAGRTDAVLRLEGDGSYLPNTGRFTELRNFGECLSYRMPDGTEQENRNVVLFPVGAVLGHKEASNVVLHKLDHDGR